MVTSLDIVTMSATVCICSIFDLFLSLVGDEMNHCGQSEKKSVVLRT